MSEKRRFVCVWRDSESDPENPLWVVSQDELDADAGAVTTETLSCHLNVNRAIWAAMREGERLDLPVYSMPSDGPMELLKPARTPEE